jgi:hypothetical protein
MKFRRQVPPPDFLRWIGDPLPVGTTKQRKYCTIELARDLSVVNELQALKESINRGTADYCEYALTANRDVEQTEKIISTFFCFEKMTDVSVVELSRVQNSVYRFKNARIIELRFAGSMHGTDPDSSVHIEDCWIERLQFDASSGTDLHLARSWVGRLDLTTHRFRHFQMNGGGLLLAESPPPYGANPFAGSVTFDKTYLPRKDGEYKGNLSGSQPWANMRSHLLALGNQKDAGLFHATQLAIEEQYEGWGAAKIVSWIYRICSDYGNSIARPAVLLAGSVLVFFVFYLLPGATVSGTEDTLQGWQLIFAQPGNLGQFLRAAHLSASPVLNPLGGVLGGLPAVEPSNLFMAIAHGIHRLVSIMLIFLLFLGIRRRFRM